MALRFLADHCVPNSVIQTLRDARHEVLRLRDLLPVESPDAVVIRKAQEIGAVLLSLNGDFADIVTYPPGSYEGIVALQVRNHPEVLPPLMTRLTTYLKAEPAMEHYRGKLLVVEVDGSGFESKAEKRRAEACLQQAGLRYEITAKMAPWKGAATKSRSLSVTGRPHPHSRDSSFAPLTAGVAGLGSGGMTLRKAKASLGVRKAASSRRTPRRGGSLCGKQACYN